MIIDTVNHAAIAAVLINHVGKRCEVAARTTGADGYGIHVSGTLVMEEGRFSATICEPGGAGNGCAVFGPSNVREIRVSCRGTLLVSLNI